MKFLNILLYLNILNCNCVIIMKIFLLECQWLNLQGNFVTETFWCWFFYMDSLAIRRCCSAPAKCWTGGSTLLLCSFLPPCGWREEQVQTTWAYKEADLEQRASSSSRAPSMLLSLPSPRAIKEHTTWADFERTWARPTAVRELG